MDFKDYYDLLGIPRDATQAQIAKAYRKLARTYHPDVNKDAGAEAQFKEIGEAHEVLKDEGKRARYDRYGAAWKEVEQAGSGPRGFDNIHFDFGPGGSRTYAFGDERFGSFFDVLERMFGDNGDARHFGTAFGSPANGQRRAAPGTDQESFLSLTLEDAAEGGKREIALKDGESGRLRRLKVRVPEGVTDGQRIRLAGQGRRGSGDGRPGDLYLVVRISRHNRFRLHGDDLHTVIEIAPWQAALGGSIRLRTLDQTVNFKIPAGSSSGRRIRLRGKGYPAQSGPGDLYAEVRIVVPETLSVKEEELYKALSKVTEAA